MRKLNENCVYSLEELTNEELKELWIYLTKVYEDWADCPFEEMIKHQKKYRLFFNNYNWSWRDSIEPTANAKELFYTLENIQVDCRELSEEQIDNLVNVYESNNIPKAKGSYDRKDVKGRCNFIMRNYSGCHWFSDKEIKFNTITYEKFMELFAEPQYEIKHIAEQPKETFNPQPHYNNDKGSLYKVAQDRNWNAYLFDVVKRLERGGKKDPLEQEIQKSIDVLKLWLIEATQ